VEENLHDKLSLSLVVIKKKNDQQYGMNGEICLQLLLLFWLKDGALQH